MSIGQIVLSIPKISAKKCRRLARRIRPVIEFSRRSGPYGYGRRPRIDIHYKGRLYWANVNAEAYDVPLHLMNMCWDPRATAPAKGLKSLGSVQIFIENSEAGNWFMPTLSEILAQIPQRLRGHKIIGFKIPFQCDLSCAQEDKHESGNPTGYHKATIIVYTRR